MLANDTTATFTLPDCWNDCLKVKGVISDEWEPKNITQFFKNAQLINIAVT
jgi:hypothetical protein